MSELKPVAWLCKNKSTGRVFVDLNDIRYSNTRERNDWESTPLYALPEGHVIMPVEPTENQWSGLARHLMMWLDLTDRPTGEKLYSHLDMLGIDPPAWLLEEIPNTDTVPSKGTRVAVIYKAMLKATQEEG